MSALIARTPPVATIIADRAPELLIKKQSKPAMNGSKMLTPTNPSTIVYLPSAEKTALPFFSVPWHLLSMISARRLPPVFPQRFRYELLSMNKTNHTESIHRGTYLRRKSSHVMLATSFLSSNF
jgi:hypothetical protein